MVAGTTHNSYFTSALLLSEIPLFFFFLPCTLHRCSQHGWATIPTMKKWLSGKYMYLPANVGLTLARWFLGTVAKSFFFIIVDIFSWGELLHGHQFHCSLQKQTSTDHTNHLWANVLKITPPACKFTCCKENFHFFTDLCTCTWPCFARCTVGTWAGSPWWMRRSWVTLLSRGTSTEPLTSWTMLSPAPSSPALERTWPTSQAQSGGQLLKISIYTHVPVYTVYTGWESQLCRIP